MKTIIKYSRLNSGMYSTYIENEHIKSESIESLKKIISSRVKGGIILVEISKISSNNDSK